ncbi:MAG TPA: VCBS repeat-containing protein [Terriglobales bacterium]|nr:VCBS repeat-containing protein [Terriglobales bacterium]
MASTGLPRIKVAAFVSLILPLLIVLVPLMARGQIRTASLVHPASAGSLANVTFKSVINPIFLSPVTYATGNIMQDVAVVDINRDEKPDLLVTTRADDNTGLISVFVGNGDGSFEYPNGTYSTAGQAASSALVRDVNGDGKPDVVVAEACASWLDNCVSGDTLAAVLLSNGDGTFQPAVVYQTGGYDFALSVAVADVNGDRKPDLIVADWRCTSTGFDGCVSVLLANGDGTFQTAQVYGSGGSNAEEILVTDVNGDGNPDLVVTNGGGSPSTVGILLGNGDGTFQAAASYDSGGGFAIGLRTRDLNHDKKPDLLVTNVYSDNTAVLLGNGDGTFGAAVPYASGGQGIVATVLSDVNGDGLPDLVLANCGALYGFCPGNGSVDVLLGNADGTFGSAVGYGVWTSPQAPEDLVVTDLNRDGHPDIAVITSFSGSTTVLPGNGDGTFQPGVSYNSGAFRETVVKSADLNGDGTPDLVVGGQDSLGHGVLGILLNTTPARTPLATVTPTHGRYR